MHNECGPQIMGLGLARGAGSAAFDKSQSSWVVSSTDEQGPLGRLTQHRVLGDGQVTEKDFHKASQVPPCTSQHVQIIET